MDAARTPVAPPEESPRGRRRPDRGSEKFASSIAELTDPLALKVHFFTRIR